MSWQPDPERFPFYHLVPKDPVKNAEFRDQILLAVELNPEFGRTIWEMCSRDLLFFINVFCFTYNPRKDATGESKMLPFITWDSQDEILAAIDDAVGRHDLAMRKSREMGASWMVLVVFLWRWMFRRHSAFGALSRVKEYADKRDDKDALLPKIDLMLQYLPCWLCPGFVRNEGILINTDNGSTITVDASTGNAFRAGRKTAVMIDEAAYFEKCDEMLDGLADVTSSRIGISTPNGISNGFYRFHQRSKHKVFLHWSKHPDKARGMYTTTKGGELVKLDVTYQYPLDFAPILDGKLRSPWYDHECTRRTPRNIAQDLDGEFIGSQSLFFDAGIVNAHAAKYARSPSFVGELHFDPITAAPLGLVETANGCLKLWIEMRADGTPPDDRDYGCASDISAGSGASNSVCSIGDLKTNELVGELVTSYLKPVDFAAYVCALGMFFHGTKPSWEDLQRDHDGDGEPQPGGAIQTWEVNGGPGSQFTGEMIRRNYADIVFRDKDEGISPVPTDKPGWASSKATKIKLLGEYERALKTDEFINHSQDSLDECLAYVHTADGGVAHSGALDSSDPSGAGENHGDRCISTALLRKIMSDRVVKRQEEHQEPRNCFAARSSSRKRRKQGSWSW